MWIPTLRAKQLWNDCTIIFNAFLFLSYLQSYLEIPIHFPVEKARNILCWWDKRQESRKHVFYSPPGHHGRGWRGSWLFLQRKECLNFVFLPFLMLINEICYFPIVQKLPDTLVLLNLKTFFNHGLSPVVGYVCQIIQTPHVHPGETCNCKADRTIREASGRKLHIPPCLAHEHNGALSSSGSRGCAFRARRRIPAWVPPRAEGPPGPGKLQFPACAATDAPAYRSYRAGAGWFKALC